jgi:radical SAM protein with 4Fe4S-binding SPASM domain
VANLSITSACNRNCIYCFAKAAFNGQASHESHMSLSTFQQSLDFLDRSGINQVRLLGGEPTLHPEFSFMIDQIMDKGFDLLIFSNGLMPDSALRRLEGMPVERVTILINVAVPSESEAEEHKKQLSVFRRLGSRVLLGLNIFKPSIHLDFMLDLINEFKLSPTIRLGLAHPCLSVENKFLHPRYYPTIGRKIISFAERARKFGVNIEFDCGFIPCMFPADRFEALGEKASDIGLRCNPIFDILPDGSVASCYPLSSLYREALPDRRDAVWLKKKFEKKLAPYRNIGVYHECSICKLWKRGDCNGGCTASAMMRLRTATNKFLVADIPDKLLQNGGAIFNADWHEQP